MTTRSRSAGAGGGERGARRFADRPAGTVPLERALSKLGIASRSEARRLVAEGRVAVDGRGVRDPLEPVVPERVRIEVDGAEVRGSRDAGRVVLALHKPRGVVTTRRDPEGRRTVFDLLGTAGEGLVAVGRLDLATSGLILLTNDTRLADRLTDPASGLPRVYLATVRGEVTEEEAERLRRGVEESGERLAPVDVVVRKRSGRESHVVVTLAEGKNREVRRLLAAVGHEVTRLRRVSFGGIGIGELAPGEWREVDEGELGRAFPGFGIRSPGRPPSPPAPPAPSSDRGRRSGRGDRR